MILLICSASVSGCWGMILLICSLGDAEDIVNLFVPGRRQFYQYVSLFGGMFRKMTRYIM